MEVLRIRKYVAISQKMNTPQIVGILNLTPNSFSDGGDFLNSEIAIRESEKMLQSGAKILDLGAESTAPNSPPVSEEEESKRLFPILQKVILLKKKYDFAISIDTYKSGIAQRALQEGADMINDVTAFRGDPKMSEVVARFDARVILMFSKNDSARTDFSKTEYEDIFATLEDFFVERIEVAKNAGIAEEKIILDPGMGAFLSADPAVSFAVLKNLNRLKSKFPKHEILAGTSRKSFLREVSDAENPKNRLMASVISALWAGENGADFLRVHDVPETAEALQTWHQIQNA